MNKKMSPAELRFFSLSTEEEGLREEHLQNCLDIWRESANVEDTEPANNFGFMKDPHEGLYPAAFDGDKMRQDANEKLKAHVLNAIELEYPNSDSFIYFTVYGSGASYNWDEEGDFDIQMWVDYAKFQDQKGEGTQDDLLADLRRITQTINFPSFKELGLDTADCEGAMLIQYYPKPGTGSKEENLTSKPYACYDMETDEWLYHPEPITPEFYGDGFLMTMPKAEDVALQAEAVLSELERNTVNWQFWRAMADKYDNKAYNVEAMDAQDKATQAKDGVINLFENVFQGRAGAYSEEGEGIKDERDILQKLLEVWGIFQRLKHYAREPLPWETQELPKKEEALQGLPANAIGEHPPLNQIAQNYMVNTGLPYNPPQDYALVDPDKATQIAQAYEAMEHNPNDPQVQSSYRAFIDETKAQYEELVRHGYNFEFYPPDHDPYPGGPRQAIEDLRDNKHLYVFPSSGGFGSNGNSPDDHPLLEDSGVRWNGEPVTANDLFRAVHDVFGHGKEGVGFRHHGEENAWRQHASMYSNTAKPAMTAETRGQNSWVNFGPHGQSNQTADQMSTVYADQKAGLMPDWVHTSKRSSWRVEGAWSDVVEKAQRYYDEGRTQLTTNQPTNVVGTVQGDSGTYNTEIWRDDPNNPDVISLWGCDCPWGQKSWGRTRIWKKYEGRPCAHAVVLNWEAQRQPQDTDAQGNEQMQMFDPDSTQTQQPSFEQTMADPSQGQEPIVPTTPSTPSTPPGSQLKGPKDINQFEFPGTFSGWKRVAVVPYNNGDFVRAKEPLDGTDDRGTKYIVPRNMVGEVIWSDGVDTIAIFSIEAGPLGPHLVRVECDTEQLMNAPTNMRGPAPRRRSGKD